MERQLSTQTKAVHSKNDNKNRGVMPPIDLSTTFEQEDVENIEGYFYGRITNPTLEALEDSLANIEKSCYAAAFSSGMSAIETTLAAITKSGDEILACRDLYGGTHQLLRHLQDKMNISTRYTDATDAENIKKAINERTKVIWIESPTNPLLSICPIEEISRIAKSFPEITVVVDNTFATPMGQRPLELGADISLHSITKYINGHSDVVAGGIMTNKKDLYEKILEKRIIFGTQLGPLECFLVLRGIKTLPLRMKQHEKSALALARFLENHDSIEKVIYPGLLSHPQHILARKQMDNYGGMLSFKLNTDKCDVQSFLSRLQLFACAVSLGGVESLIEVPYFMTHKNMPAEAKQDNGITKNLIRVSVGIEDTKDLIADIHNALRG